MRLPEICFWVAVFWLTYMPVSGIIFLALNKGSLLGILLIGCILSAIFAVILSFQEGSIMPELEPAIIIEQPAEIEVKEKESEVENEEEPKETFDLGVEPSPKMRTDVDLDKLDAPDDNLPS